MKRKNLYILIISLAAMAGIVLFFNKNKTPSGDADIVIFYSDSCPHCLNVEKFLEENKVLEKVDYTRKSVDNNPGNVSELQQKALACNLIGDIGIPFLWNKQTSKCSVGDEDIINFFKEKIK